MTGFERDSKGRFKNGYKLENDSRNHSIEARRRQKIADEKYYSFYNKGMTDKQISKETNSGVTAVQSWRWRRGLKPNHPNNMNGRNDDGTFKLQTITGSKDIHLLCRAGLERWRNKILKRDNYICQVCHDDSGTNLQVHHNKISFKDVINKCIPKEILGKEDNMSNKEKKDIASNVIDYHYKNNVEGIALCKECHMWVHNLNPLNFQ